MCASLLIYTSCQLVVTSKTISLLKHIVGEGWSRHVHERSASHSKIIEAGISLPTSCKELCSVLPAARHQDAWDGWPSPDVCTHSPKSQNQPHDRPMRVTHTHPTTHASTSCTHPHEQALTHIKTTAHPPATCPPLMHPTIRHDTAQLRVRPCVSSEAVSVRASRAPLDEQVHT